MLVVEGQTVKKGDVLVHLGDASDTNYAGRPARASQCPAGLNDLQNTAGEDLAQVVIELRDATENDASITWTTCKF